MPYPTVTGFFLALSSAWGLSAGLPAHAVQFDRRSVERERVHHRTSIPRNIQAGAQVDKFQIVYTSFMQSDDERSTRGYRCDDYIPIQRSLSMQIQQNRRKL
jgi:hypothetical protein